MELELVARGAQDRGPGPVGLSFPVLASLALVVAAVPALNVALPGVAADTGATQSHLQWIVDAYALVFAALLLPAGALGDRYGRKPLLVLRLLVLGAGSAAAALCATPGPLIGARAVMGVGAAMVMPTTLSIITSSFPVRERAPAPRRPRPLADGDGARRPVRHAPRLAGHLSRRGMSVGGVLLIAVGMLVLSLLDSGSSYWMLLGGILPLGAGMALATAPATTGIVAALPASRQGVGSAVNDAAREVGGALGIAVLGSILNAVYRTEVPKALPDTLSAHAEPAQDSLPAALAVAARLGGPGADVAGAARDAFSHGMTVAFLVSAGLLVPVSAALAAFQPHGGVTARSRGHSWASARPAIRRFPCSRILMSPSGLRGPPGTWS